MFQCWEGKAAEKFLALLVPLFICMLTISLFNVSGIQRVFSRFLYITMCYFVNCLAILSSIQMSSCLGSLFHSFNLMSSSNFGTRRYDLLWAPHCHRSSVVGVESSTLSTNGVVNAASTWLMQYMCRVVFFLCYCQLIVTPYLEDRGFNEKLAFYTSW